VLRKRIVLDSVSQSFEFATSTKPLLINVDAEKMLVCTKKDMHSKEEWLHMFYHVPLFLDKLEALESLDKYKTDSIVQIAFLKALDDPFYSVKTLAISKVKALNETHKKLAYPKLKDLAINDKKSIVRARALKAIIDFYSDQNNVEVFASAEKDLSYQVESSLFKYYVNSNKEKAWAIAKKEEKSNNSTIQLAISEFYGKEGTAAEHSFFLNLIERKTNFTLFLIMPHYKAYIKRMDDEVIKTGVQAVADVSKNTTNTFAINAIRGVLKEMKNTAKAEELKQEIQTMIDKLAN
jgi:aminopeptidase N